MDDRETRTESAFEEIGESTADAVGPAAVLLSGFAEPEAERVLTLLAEVGAKDHRVLRCASEMLDRRLTEALSGAPGDPLPAEALPRVVILSGLPDAGINAVVDRWADTGLPRPLFACATPSSLELTVKRLLSDLLREHRALSR
jgi:hypothetical protein